MKQTISLLCLAITLQVIAQEAQSDSFGLTKIAEMERDRHQSLRDFRANALTHDYDLKYHRIHWTVDPAVRYISGEITYYFVPTVPDFRSLHLDCSTQLMVSNVTYRGEELSFSQFEPALLKINFDNALKEGVVDSITLNYEGVPEETGLGSFVQSSHAATPIIWTLSEPYGARDWWPCKQSLNDKIDSIDVYITTDPEYKVASNGLLVSEVQSDSLITYHWKHRYLIPAYLIAIAVTNYAEYSDYVEMPDGDTLEILNYVYPEDISTLQQQSPATVDIMEFFNTLFGEYPFADEKYGHAQWGRGGSAMEHTTMSFMHNFSHGLIAHELAHQWFGNQITCGSWHDIWLNEGFATYLEGITYEFNLPTGAVTWRQWLDFRRRFVTDNTFGNVYVADTTNVNRIFSSRLTYSKGALLLHMLRWIMGDKDFFEAVRNYLNDPDLAFGYARTIDLQRHLEALNAWDFEEFFNDWFYNEGHPTYHIQWWNGSHGVNFNVSQSQSHGSVDFFEMPIPIHCTGEGQDTILRFDHMEQGQLFSAQLPFEVEQVRFDPDWWILSRNDVVEFVLVSNEEVEAIREAVVIAPVPVTDQVRISIDPQYQIEKAQLFYASGKSIKQFTPSSAEFAFSMQQYPAGNYLLMLEVDGIRVTERFIKI